MELQEIAEKLTHPYQIFVAANFPDDETLSRVLTILSGANPYTPFEIIFLGPTRLRDSQRLLPAIRLSRPHFLDIEQRFLYPHPGNRAVIFTLVSERREVRFTGEMQRQVFWWKNPVLPERQDLDNLFGLDGVVIDAPLPDANLVRWQDRFAPLADDIPHIGFSDLALQNRWLLKTAGEQYAEKLLYTLESF